MDPKAFIMQACQNVSNKTRNGLLWDNALNFFPLKCTAIQDLSSPDILLYKFMRLWINFFYIPAAYSSILRNPKAVPRKNYRKIFAIDSLLVKMDTIAQVPSCKSAKLFQNTYP